MIDDVRTYFYEFIISYYLDYRNVMENPTFGRFKTLKASIDFSTNLFHFREKLPTNLSVSQTDLESDLYEFKILGNFVNVTKHGQNNTKFSFNIYK